MKRSIIITCIKAFMIMLLLTSCQTEKAEAIVTEDVQNAETKTNPKEESTLPKAAMENYPKVDGSTATQPLSAELFRAVTGASEAEADTVIAHTKTSNSYYNLLDKQIDLVLAYEPSEEVLSYIEENKAEIILKPIGKDALVFIANIDNPLTSLTEEQLINIYSGKLKNWSEAGGENKVIKAFQRPENSGSQTLMQKLVMKDIKMMEAPKVMIPTDMMDIIEKVMDYENDASALGYSVYYYAKNMYKQPKLRFMEIDGVLPSNETIKNAEYPYINEFYAAISKDTPKDSMAYKLFDWLTTEEGQQFIEKQGYVGIK